MLLYDIHTHSCKKEYNIVCIENYIIRSASHFDPVPGWLYSVGIHPWYIEDREKQIQQLRQSVSCTEVVAIGECGLDKTLEKPMDFQIEVFEEQVNLAEQTGMPMIIHCVKAWEELIRCYKKRLHPTPWVIHGFRGNPELARQLTGTGFYLSFGEKYNPLSLPVAWPDRLFIETDESRTPLLDIYSGIGGQLKITIETLATDIQRNTERVFAI